MSCECLFMETASTSFEWGGKKSDFSEHVVIGSGFFIYLFGIVLWPNQFVVGTACNLSNSFYFDSFNKRILLYLNLDWDGCFFWMSLFWYQMVRRFDHDEKAFLLFLNTKDFQKKSTLDHVCQCHQCVIIWRLKLALLSQPLTAFF